MGNLAFGSTTAILHRLLDQPEMPLIRADLGLQIEKVEAERSHVPPSTLVSTAWAPWWEFELGSRIPASQFRPMPSVDGGVLRVIKRTPSLLPPAMAGPYAQFVRQHWPFAPKGGVMAEERSSARPTGDLIPVGATLELSGKCLTSRSAHGTCTSEGANEASGHDRYRGGQGSGAE